MKKALIISAAFILCLGVLLFCVNFVAYNKSFYNAQFKANETAEMLGITQEELNEARDSIINYLYGNKQTLDIEVFTEDELSHMADAKAVFSFVRVMAYTLIIAGIAALIALYIKEKNKIWKNVAWGSGGFLALIALIGLLALLNFDGIFTVFHNIAFPQGNWQFSQSSQMLAMFPYEFFTSAVFIIAGTGTAFAMVLTLTAIVINVKVKARKHERNIN